MPEIDSGHKSHGISVVDICLAHLDAGITFMVDDRQQFSEQGIRPHGLVFTCVRQLGNPVVLGFACELVLVKAGRKLCSCPPCLSMRVSTYCYHDLFYLGMVFGYLHRVTHVAMFSMHSLFHE